jgi:hypothetical protein
MDWHLLKYDFGYRVTSLCLWVIKTINRQKDRGLAQVLFDLAENYNTHPGTFDYATREEQDKWNPL